jgi:hypothetical protein
VALSTDFAPEDLLLNPDYLEDNLFQKQQELSDLDNVQSEMIKNFSDGAIFAVQLYFNHKDDSPSKESDYQNKSGLTLINNKKAGMLSLLRVYHNCTSLHSTYYFK